MKPSLQAQISEIERELALRKNVYAGLVRSQRMKQGEADLHMTIMGQVLLTLKWLQKNEATVRTAVGPDRDDGGEVGP